MEGTYHTEVENDGSNLVLVVHAGDALRLRLAVPWSRISEAVAREIRARFSGGAIAIHFIGGDDGMRFSLGALVDDWVDRFDPSDAAFVRERDGLIEVLRECLSRVEGTAAQE